MKKANLFIAALSVMGALLLTNCKKEKDTLPPNTVTPPVTPPASVTPARSFGELTFSRSNAYFSTDGSMTVPVDSATAKTITSKIDITFIYNYDYFLPGFMDPITRSQVWYWNDYYEPWFSNGVQTRYYKTSLTKTEFDAAKADQSKIGTYLADTNIAKLAPHSIYPTGTCIGGRISNNPTSETLNKMDVYGFKNTVSGKQGLIYISYGQYQGWPNPISNFDTKVEIIKEN